MGTPSTTATAPSKRIPSFISILRLESSSDKLIELLLEIAMQSNTAGLEIEAAARQAMPPHRRHPRKSWACQAHRHANRARPIRAVRRSQRSAGFGSLRAQDKNRQQ